MARQKMTEAERATRKLDRKAADMNARAARDYGPLFASLAPTYSRDDAYWHTRANYSRGAEALAQNVGPAQRGMKLFMVNVIEQHARKLLGDDVFTRLVTKCRETFSDQAGYAYGFWRDALTEGKQVIFGYDRVDDASCTMGFRCVPSEFWPAVGYVPPMTRDEFHERFPFADAPLGDEPDDGGLYERLMNIANNLKG